MCTTIIKSQNLFSGFFAEVADLLRWTDDDMDARGWMLMCL